MKMNMSSIRWSWLCLSLGLFCGLSPIPLRAEEKGAVSAKEAVVRLYQDYAWVVLIDDPGLKGLVIQSQKELSKYFTPSLASLLDKDYQCVEETKEICSLDFDPIYDSQDPDGAHHLRVEPMNADHLVRVTFSPRWSSPQITEIKFKMVNTTTGWRIDDIVYQGHESLRALLTRRKP